MISVCMATYNGEKYLRQQIDSILKNISSKDELVISDDGSKDNTLGIVKRYMKEDPRISLVFGPKKGFVKNFENAIKHSKGEYIFLSDQDDIWLDNKVSEVMKCFETTGATLVVHDCQIIDEHSKIIASSFFKLRNSGPGVMHNLIKNSYIGCCMAFKRELVNVALPIPPRIHWHDEWLGLINDKIFNKTFFLPQVLFSYRRHGDNVSSMHHSSIINMINARCIFYTELQKRAQKVNIERK